MIRTLILLALLAVMVAIARSHPGVLPEAAQSAGAAIEKQVREAEKQVEKAVAAAKPIVSDVLSPALVPESAPARPVPTAATPKQRTQDKAPLLPDPFLMPRGPAGPDLPATPTTPVEQEALPASKPGKTMFAGSPTPTEPAGPSAGNLPARPPSPAADRASDARIQGLLRDAARILAETELPK